MRVIETAFGWWVWILSRGQKRKCSSLGLYLGYVTAALVFITGEEAARKSGRPCGLLPVLSGTQAVA